MSGLRFPEGTLTSTRSKSDREIAGTSSRRATCRPPSAARAESTAASARPHGAESIEHIGADRRGPVRGADRAGARCTAAYDCQNAFSSFCSRRKVNGKKVGTQRPAQPHRGAPLVLRFLLLCLVPEQKACEVRPPGPVLETVLKCKLAIFSRK